MDADRLDGNRTLREQWEFHRDHRLRARLHGLTDDEYLWSPVPEAWSVRPRGSGAAPVQAGAGDLRIDHAYPDAPVADLVPHIHREPIHHLSEVCLLRDLYLHTHGATP